MFCDFFNQNLKASISWAGFAVRLSVCLSVRPSLPPCQGVLGELARPLPCVRVNLLCLIFISFRLRFGFYLLSVIYLCLLCAAFLSLIFLLGAIRRQSLSSSSAEAASSSWGRVQGAGLLGNPWLMIFPKLNQSEIESNLLSSSFCASDYATQISGQRECVGGRCGSLP